MPYANNKGADQPALSRSLISAFVIPCLDSILITLFSISTYMQNLKPLASLYSWAGQFEPYLATNLEDRFSCDDQAHLGNLQMRMHSHSEGPGMRGYLSTASPLPFIVWANSEAFHAGSPVCAGHLCDKYPFCAKQIKDHKYWHAPTLYPLKNFFFTINCCTTIWKA